MTTGRGRTGQHVCLLAVATAVVTGDGWLQLADGALYAAPSPAAAACCGVLTNGWKAWHHAADGRSLLTFQCLLASAMAYAEGHSAQITGRLAPPTRPIEPWTRQHSPSLSASLQRPDRRFSPAPNRCGAGLKPVHPLVGGNPGRTMAQNRVPLACRRVSAPR